MSKKLLLADASVTIQRVIELTFAEEDIQVVAVGDGQRALERIESERPDIVLADVGMPTRSGYEVAAFVKESPHLRHVPVLLLTGAFAPVDEERARAIGCDGVLVKPFEPQTVISRVRELLAGQRSEALWPGGAGAAAAGVELPPALDERLGPTRAPGMGPPMSAPGAPQTEGPPADRAVDRAGFETLDDYFDRLDAAFASLGAVPAAPGEQAPPPQPSREERPAPAPDSSAGPGPEARVPDPPPRTIAPYPDRDARETAPALPPRADDSDDGGTDRSWESPPREEGFGTPGRPARAPEGAVARTGQPPLAEAFAALLAAEQGQPAALRLTPPARAAVTDELVDAVTRRVLERLTDRLVRDVVADVTLEVAERLVRDEIDRIKRHAGDT